MTTTVEVAVVGAGVVGSAIARTSPVTCAAMPSATARARCDCVVASDRPRKAPRACGFQSGAPTPASEGTKSTPPASRTDPLFTSRSAGPSMMPRCCSHLTAAPTA